MCGQGCPGTPSRNRATCQEPFLGGALNVGSACLAVILVLHAMINFMPTRFLALWNGASTVWHIIGTFVLIILLPAVAPTHQTRAFVFTEFDSDTTSSGVPSSGRVTPPYPLLMH